MMWTMGCSVPPPPPQRGAVGVGRSEGGESESPLRPVKLVSTIDMGTNSFKLLLVRALPNGRFLSLDRFKDPVLLGRSPDLPLPVQLRALSAVRRFDHLLRLHRFPHPPFAVATSAVRSAPDPLPLISLLRRELGLPVHLLSGDREAHLAYLSALQALPVFHLSALAVDIGGGSTELVLGLRGRILLSASLPLGHLTLTDSFPGKLPSMRQFIRDTIRDSQVPHQVKELGFDVAVGCSGTIRSIEGALFMQSKSFIERERRFSKEELGEIVERLVQGENPRQIGFSKRRAEFIVAGAVLLWEIFEAFRIEEMEVSDYALGEGLAAEILARECEDFDACANARWRSVVRLVSRINGEKKMKSNSRCAGIAKEMAEGLGKCEELTDHQNKCMSYLNYKDLEYLEAAILLHSVGLVMGKKGYHKKSYLIIKNGKYLYSYNDEEIEVIALLARHHRKSFPSCENDSFQRFSKEMKHKFRVLSAIMRISLAIHKHRYIQNLDVEPSPDGFKMVLNERKEQCLSTEGPQPIPSDIETELKPELEYFKEVFQQGLSIVVV